MEINPEYVIGATAVVGVLLACYLVGYTVNMVVTDLNNEEAALASRLKPPVPATLVPDASGINDIRYLVKRDAERRERRRLEQLAKPRAPVIDLQAYREK